MILSYLILAHLLGDFVFQPSKLVRWKMHSKYGTLVHVLVHFAVSIIVLLPFILQGYLSLIALSAGITFVHFWIDEAKINYDIKHDNKVAPFVIDQVLHVFTIITAYILISGQNLLVPANWFYDLYTDARLINFIALVVFITTVIEIFRYQELRQKNKKAQFKPHKEAMFNRMFLFTVIYLFLMIVSLYISGQTIF